MNTTKSEKFATIQDTKIAILVDGFPEHDIQENQIALSSGEYWLLKSVNGDLQRAKSIIRDIESKIKALVKEK